MHKELFITIDHIEDFCPCPHLRPGDVLILRKDLCNPYDDEAIAVYDDKDMKIGYVANSVRSVARGTCSAGRIYDQMKEEENCKVCFILDDVAIARLQ